MLAIRKLARGVANVSVEELPAPVAGPEEIVVEVDSAGICGTECSGAAPAADTLLRLVRRERSLRLALLNRQRPGSGSKRSLNRCRTQAGSLYHIPPCPLTSHFSPHQSPSPAAVPTTKAVRSFGSDAALRSCHGNAVSAGVAGEDCSRNPFRGDSTTLKQADL